MSVWPALIVAPSTRLAAVPPSGCCRGDRRLGRITDRSLQHLVGDRLRGIDQLLQRGDAGVGGLQNLHAVADAVEQIVDVAGAVVEALRGEEVGRIVERGVDLLAGRKAVLRGGEQVRGGLEREQVLANRCRENDTEDIVLPSWCEPNPIVTIGSGHPGPKIIKKN